MSGAAMGSVNKAFSQAVLLDDLCTAASFACLCKFSVSRLPQGIYHSSERIRHCDCCMTFAVGSIGELFNFQ